MVLQAWLNFGITLIAPPANGLMHVGHQHSHCLSHVLNGTWGPAEVEGLTKHDCVDLQHAPQQRQPLRDLSASEFMFSFLGKGFFEAHSTSGAP